MILAPKKNSDPEGTQHIFRSIHFLHEEKSGLLCRPRPTLFHDEFITRKPQKVKEKKKWAIFFFSCFARSDGKRDFLGHFLPTVFPRKCSLK